MRTRPILLSKTCPYCGARSIAEAKLPVPANMPAVEYNLDNVAQLVDNLSLSLLLALVELLPYKTFSCRKCQGEFRMESKVTKDLVGGVLTSMRPVIPQESTKKTARPKPRPAAPAMPPQAGVPPPAGTPPRPAPSKPLVNKDWQEPESLDALFDYSVDPNKH